MFAKILGALEVGLKNAALVMHRLSWLMLFALLILGTSDVLGRYFFNRPITGTREISSILVVGIVVFGWAYVQSKKGHVKIDFVVSRFPSRAQVITELVVSFISLAVFGTIVWQSAVIAMRHWEMGYLVSVIQIPIAPFQLLVTLGALTLCLEYIYEIISLSHKISKEG